MFSNSRIVNRTTETSSIIGTHITFNLNWVFNLYFIPLIAVYIIIDILDYEQIMIGAPTKFVSVNRLFWFISNRNVTQ